MFTQFKTFVAEIDSLLLETINLIEDEGDTIEWNPETGADFKGSGGYNTPTGHGQRGIKRPSVSKPKDGDVVFIQDPNGKYTPGLITQVDQDNVVVSNKLKNIVATRPISSLHPAAPALMKQFPGRTGWIYQHSILSN